VTLYHHRETPFRQTATRCSGAAKTTTPVCFCRSRTAHSMHARMSSSLDRMLCPFSLLLVCSLLSVCCLSAVHCLLSVLVWSQDTALPCRYHPFKKDRTFSDAYLSDAKKHGYEGTCLLSAICCLLSVSCILSGVWCVTSLACAVCCLLSAVCCLLSAVCCLLSAVCVGCLPHQRQEIQI
jgi:hypothetical protein